MLLKQTDLLRVFKQRLQSAQHVDLASAWATEGKPLELLRAAKRCGAAVRAIVGTHGNTTTPEALRMLRKIGELRLVGRTGPLFHPKLYIFRGDENFAWVGSANFTGKGFGENEELVLETREVDEVAAWFEARWRQCGPLNYSQLREYIENHEEPTGLGDQRASLPARKYPTASIKALTFRSDGKVRNRYRGRCRIEWSDGTRPSEEQYETHGDAVRLVLRALTRDWQDQDLLTQIQHEGPKRGGKSLLAANPKCVYRLPAHKRHEITELEGANGAWWLTPDTESKQKRKLICFAAQRHGATVGWDDSEYGF